jgi:hypothetical protein
MIREAHVPIKIRCASLDGALDDARFDGAVASAVGRALDRSAEFLNESDRAEFEPVRLCAQAATLPRADELCARIERILNQLAPTRLPMVEPEEISAEPEERFDPERYDPATASYTIPSYEGRKVQVTAFRRDEPFATLLREFHAAVVASDELLVQLRSVPDSIAERVAAIRRFQTIRDVLELERQCTVIVADVLARRRTPADIDEKLRRGVDFVAHKYYAPREVYPVPALVNDRIAQLQTGRVDASVISERCAKLDATAMKNDAGTPVRRGFFLVSAAYVDAASLELSKVPERLAFLDTLYRDPQTIVGYAVSQWASTFVPSFWESLVKMPGATGAVLFSDISRVRGPITLPNLFTRNSREAAFARTTNLTLELRDAVNRFGYLFPVDPADVTEIPTAEDAAYMAARVLHVSIDIGILALWAPIEPLQDLLHSTPNAGQHLYVFGEQDRDRWIYTLNSLKSAFAEEIARDKHDPGMKSWIDGTERQVRDLSDAITAEVSRSRTIAAVVQQIPFLFVGGAIASGVGGFVEATWGASRWLRIIAEGAALTAFNTVLQLPQRPVTVGGVALQFVLNVGFAGIGSALGSFAGDVGYGLSGMRRALTAFTGVAIPTLALSGIQTAIAAMERDVKQAGGDTDYTTVFTCNVATNALGLLFGAAFQSAKGRLPASLDVTNDAALARALGISEAAARVWRHYGDRYGELAQRAGTLGEAYRSGRLDPKEFENWRRDSLALIDEMLPIIPEVAPYIEGAPEPEALRNGLRRMRSEVASADPHRHAARFPTPESTVALVRVGDSDTYVYDPRASATARAQVDGLQRALAGRGWHVEPLPEGGFRAEIAGAPPVRILPAAPSVRGLLPPASLETMAKGQPQSTAGVAAIRTQTSVPGLEATVASAAARVSPNSTIGFLRIVRLIDPADALAWKGLDRFVREGGNLEDMRRALARRASRAEVDDLRGTAQTLLHLIGHPARPWDASAVRGLGALFRLAPNVTAERFLDLIDNPEPLQVRGIMQTFDLLDRRATNAGPVVAQLAADVAGFGPLNRETAIAVLLGAHKITERFPDATIVFEEPTPDVAGTFQRFQDIAVYETIPDAAGGGRPGRRLIFQLEFKDVLPASIGAPTRRQFVNDLILDYDARVRMGGPAARPPYAGFGWRFGRAKLLDAAMQRLNTTDPADPRIDAALRDVIRDRLRAAFSDPRLKTRIPATEVARYQAAFESDLPFVDFF